MSKFLFVKSSSKPQPAAKLSISSNIIPGNLPPKTNILLLGETGVGKSTFINAFLNYLLYGTMEEAIQKGHKVLIENKFSITDVYGTTEEVVVRSTEGTATNESMKTGQSGTQEPKSYVFEHAGGCITLIDTPGIGDVRGIDQDKINFDKVLSCISQYGEIHAICILMLPNFSRKTLAFRFCLDELLHHLHKSASENIIFCFTKVRGCSYRPGESLPVLGQHLEKLESNRQIKIKTDISTMFCVENEAFRFVCAHKQNPGLLTEDDSTDCHKSWEKAVSEISRMFRSIAALTPHNTRETLSVNNTRNVIIWLTRPMSILSKTLSKNIELMKAQKAKVTKLRVASHICVIDMSKLLFSVEELHRLGASLRDQLYIEKIVNKLVELEEPQTVCSGASCVTYRRLGSDITSPTERVYSTVCHKNCALSYIQAKTLNNPELQNCAALSSNIEKCSNCGCGWQLHMHIRYEIREEMQRDFNDIANVDMKVAEQKAACVKAYLEELQTEIDRAQKEQNVIVSSASDFAVYLYNNSILPYNDNYEEYMQLLIREQEQKEPNERQPNLLQNLRNTQAEYNKSVEMLRQSIAAGTGKAKTLEEIEAMMLNLNRLSSVGDLLKEVERIELANIINTWNHHSFFAKIPPSARSTRKL